MKKILTIALLSVFFATGLPARAATTALSAQEKQIKSQLLKVKRKQAVTKYRINRNISSAKSRIKQVQRQRKVVKAKRAAVRSGQSK